METKGISKLDLKRRNRRQILLAIRSAGMLARVDIAAQLSLTRAAVTIITNQMIAQGILEDMNTPVQPPADAPRRKGRRKTMIRINPNYKFVLGAVVDEDFVSVGLSNLADEILGKSLLQITAETTQKEIENFIIKSCRDLLKRASLSADSLLGLGIGIVKERWELVGAEASENGNVSFDRLQKKLSTALKIPVFCGNAIGLYALANVDYLDTKHRNQLLLYFGTSLQTAVTNDGELRSGLCSNSTFIDRLILTPNGTKADGYPDGSVYAEITPAALCRQVKAETGREMNVSEICNAYVDQDADVVRVINVALDKLAVMLYNLSVVYRATKVVLQSHQITEPAMGFLQKRLAELCEGSQEVTLVRSPIEGEKSFLAGCKLLMEKQFYDLGGMLPGAEKEED